MLRYIRTVRLDLVVQRDAQKQIQWSVYVQQKRPHCRSEEDEPDSTIGLLASWLMLQTPGGNMIPTLSFPPTFSQPRCKLKKKKKKRRKASHPVHLCSLALCISLSLSLIICIYFLHITINRLVRLMRHMSRGYVLAATPAVCSLSLWFKPVDILEWPQVEVAF
jgi:hypothetical protein